MGAAESTCICCGRFRVGMRRCIRCSLLYGCCSIEILTVEVLPEAARPMSWVARPGIEIGAKVTEPSTAEAAVDACVARSAPAAQTVWGEHGDVHA